MARAVNGLINKMEAVRQALTKLGNDAKPAQIQAEVKETHAIELSPSLINNYKHHLKKAGKKRGRPKGSTNGAVAQSNGTPPVGSVKQAAGSFRSTSVTLADIQAVKELTQRMGAKNLVALIELLGH